MPEGTGDGYSGVDYWCDHALIQAALPDNWEAEEPVGLPDRKCLISCL